jgi:hypothetical protein
MKVMVFVAGVEPLYYQTITNKWLKEALSSLLLGLEVYIFELLCNNVFQHPVALLYHLFTFTILMLLCFSLFFYLIIRVKSK